METDNQQGGVKVIVWCGIWDNKVLRPFHFEGSVTGDSYLDMLHVHSLRSGNPHWLLQDGCNSIMHLKFVVF